MCFSSVQFKMVSMRMEKPIYSPPVSQKFPQSRLWDSFNVPLIDDGPLSSFQGRSSKASSCLTGCVFYYLRCSFSYILVCGKWKRRLGVIASIASILYSHSANPYVFKFMIFKYKMNAIRVISLRLYCRLRREPDNVLTVNSPWYKVTHKVDWVFTIK